MGTAISYPIGRAITDTSHALSGELGLDTSTVERILRPWLLKKVPSKERFDVLQHLACRILEVRPQTPGLLYSVVRFCVLDWWKAYRRRQHESLDVEVAADDEGDGIPLVETLPDGSRLLDEFVCSFVWATEMLSQIPAQVIEIGEKRLMGSTLTAAERQRLSRWRRNHGPLSELTGD